MLFVTKTLQNSAIITTWVFLGCYFCSFFPLEATSSGSGCVYRSHLFTLLLLVDRTSTASFPPFTHWCHFCNTIITSGSPPSIPCVFITASAQFPKQTSLIVAGAAPYEIVLVPCWGKKTKATADLWRGGLRWERWREHSTEDKFVQGSAETER